MTVTKMERTITNLEMCAIQVGYSWILEEKTPAENLNITELEIKNLPIRLYLVIITYLSVKFNPVYAVSDPRILEVSSILGIIKG